MLQKEKIEDALLEAVFVTRWDESKSVCQPVLTNEETGRVIDDIIDELNKAGFTIIEK